MSSDEGAEDPWHVSFIRMRAEDTFDGQDRDYPQALLLSGTQRARLPLGSGLAALLGVWPSSQLLIDS